MIKINQSEESTDKNQPIRGECCHLGHVSDAWDSITLPGNTVSVLGIVSHAPMIDHAQHQRFKLRVEVSLSDLADVGAHGLFVARLSERALGDTVESCLTLIITSTGHHLTQTVEADAGGDGEELRVSPHPVKILAQPHWSHVHSDHDHGE